MTSISRAQATARTRRSRREDPPSRKEGLCALKSSHFVFIIIIAFYFTSALIWVDNYFVSINPILDEFSSLPIHTLQRNASLPANLSTAQYGVLSRKVIDSSSQLHYPPAVSLLRRKHIKRSTLLLPEEATTIAKSLNTIVTGYFKVPSKYQATNYFSWMVNMLSLQDAMVIFVEPESVQTIMELRSHAFNRTVIVPLDITDLPVGTLYSKEFWEDQFDRNPEKRKHKSYLVTWIWLSKSWFVSEAIHLNPFQSEFFVWSDIGCFREKRYNNKTMILHPELVPRNRIVQMAHHPPNLPDDPVFDDKLGNRSYFFHSGSQFAGYIDSMLHYHQLFLETIDIFVNRHMLLIDDQIVAQSTCLSNPELCAYLPYNQVHDNHYFGLRFMLHFGGNYNLFYPDHKLH